MDLIFKIIIFFSIFNIYFLYKIIKEEKDKTLEYYFIMIPFSMLFLLMGPIASLAYVFTELLLLDSKRRS